MCLIVFAYKKHPLYKLLVLANRDEFYDRPTQTMHRWNEGIVAGKDLQEGGTWMALGKNARFAALTNYRQLPVLPKTSRGYIVRDFAAGTTPTFDFLQQLDQQHDQYNGFNLLAGTPDELFYYSNKSRQIKLLDAGIYAVSNHLLDTPWPKLVQAREAFARLVNAPNFEPLQMFDIMSQTNTFADHQLPDTGVGIALERMLSSIFIQSPKYGTRATTLVMYDNQNRAVVTERSFIPPSEQTFTV